MELEQNKIVEMKRFQMNNENKDFKKQEKTKEVISDKLDKNNEGEISEKEDTKNTENDFKDDFTNNYKDNIDKENVEENVGKFYERGKEYWRSVEPSVNGMLGGLGHVSSIDVAESVKFLKQFVKSPVASTQCNYALDCGSGIGRVSKKLLLPLFKSVDMVEVSQHFLDAAPAFIGEEASRIGCYFCCGLQEFVPEVGKYDVIWCQWVLGHLTDDGLVAFFKRCKAGLAPRGLLCFKENVSSNSELDQKDSAYTRSRQHFVDLVTLAGLSVVKETKQKNFPSELYQVRMFAVS